RPPVGTKYAVLRQHTQETPGAGALNDATRFAGFGLDIFGAPHPDSADRVESLWPRKRLVCQGIARSRESFM
ncbi:MAG: hypothetical protein MOB07_26460, partial [Acidobacteria bacterium]|nr:hypothetical protein [Acidobacteriota bacterium]